MTLMSDVLVPSMDERMAPCIDRCAAALSSARSMVEEGSETAAYLELRAAKMCVESLFVQLANAVGTYRPAPDAKEAPW